MNEALFTELREELPLPIIQKAGVSKFLLIISQTQLTKSTINANAVIRKCFHEGELINFNEMSPGEKKMMPCTIHIHGESIKTQASFLIPKRRGDTNPEPRFWPYKLASYVSKGTKIWFTASENMLEIEVSID